MVVAPVTGDGKPLCRAEFRSDAGGVAQHEFSDKFRILRREQHGDSPAETVPYYVRFPRADAGGEFHNHVGVPIGISAGGRRRAVAEPPKVRTINVKIVFQTVKNRGETLVVSTPSVKQQKVFATAFFSVKRVKSADLDDFLHRSPLSATLFRRPRRDNILCESQPKQTRRRRKDFLPRGY